METGSRVDPIKPGDILESSYTALDRFWNLPPAPIRFETLAGDLRDAAARFEPLEFPRLPYADCSFRTGDSETRLSCLDDLADGGGFRSRHAFPQLDLAYSPRRKAFRFPEDAYPLLRSPVASAASGDAETLLFETAVLLARYPYRIEPVAVDIPSTLSADWQRDLLVLALTGHHPERAFQFLLDSGFLDRHWPELAGLHGVEHSKDFHPEGDVWRHTMETFRHRKDTDLTVALALLLHDSGKPAATGSKGRRFDRHAELGADIARDFLARLGFPRDLCARVDFLVRQHMMPAVCLDPSQERIRSTMGNPLYPRLLELYRCDELSMFRGPERYHEACAAYRQYLRNSKNPYRAPDGRKSVRQYVE